MKLFGAFESAYQPKISPEAAERIGDVLATLKDEGLDVGTWTQEVFTDPDLFNALPVAIREDAGSLRDYIANSEKFFRRIDEERLKPPGSEGAGLLGEVVEAPSIPHQDGRVRHAESGRKIDVAYLRTIGIDPSKVLFYRVTQPSDAPKPEYYWTSDYFETVRGLNVEIPSEQRRSAVVLVADLETIDANGGLIQDINDDIGLAVRQLGQTPFDQKETLATIHPTRP